MPFGTDAFLHYNVGEWAALGLAVPNFGDDRRSQNDTIRYYCEIVGRNLQAVMFHTDARLRVPPSLNTVSRLHRLITRARAILAARAVPSGALNLEPAHAVPAPEEFLVFPTPYFVVRNVWLKQYCGLVLLSLTEAMQHTENARPLEVSVAFSGLVGQYLQRIYRLLAIELLRVPSEEAGKADFTISDEQLAAYNPAAWFTQTEMIDVTPAEQEIPTEDDLRVLTDGIPVSRLPLLSRWPAGPVAGAVSGSTAAAGESFAPPPGV